MKKLLKKKLVRLSSFPKQLLYVTVLFVYVFIFFLAFKPFYLPTHGENMQLFLAFSYALASFIPAFTLICGLNIFEPPFFANDSWTIGKEIITADIILIPTAFFYLLIDHQYNGELLNLNGYLQSLLKVSLLSVIPIVVIIIVKLNTLLQSKVEKIEPLTPTAVVAEVENTKVISPEKDEQETQPSFDQAYPQVYKISANKSDIFNLAISDFIYAVSDGNYIDLYFTKEGIQKKKTIRGTIKNLLTDFEDHPAIIQCHRSYLVNKDKITSFKGNSRGYRIQLSEALPIIPVSRNFIEPLKEKLKEIL